MFSKFRKAKPKTENQADGAQPEPTSPRGELDPTILQEIQTLTLDQLDRKVILGTGTFGTVYLVQSHSQRYYAMKTLNKTKVIRLKQVEHINSEKNILASIHHPFIVNLYRTFQDDQHLYLLQEYVIGGEMFFHLRRQKRFSNSVAKFFAAEIILAFEYMHAQNIIYRDLKPENLLIDHEGHVKITDFGFAKRVEDRTWTLCGTPDYIAPEIIQSRGHGKAADWWALGILIFEMLAGYPPFYDDNPFGVYEKILGGRIQFPSHVDRYAEDLVRKLLTQDKTRRLGSLHGGVGDIKGHSWFAGVDWEKVIKKQIPAPIIPKVEHEGDTACFAQYDEPEEEEAFSSDPHTSLFPDF